MRKLSALAIAEIVLLTLLAPPRADAVRPNPFRKGESVYFTLTMPRAETIRIQVFDLLGRPIRLLYDGHHEAGEEEVKWDGKDENGVDVIAGVYICVLFSDGVALEAVKVVNIGFS